MATHQHAASLVALEEKVQNTSQKNAKNDDSMVAVSLQSSLTVLEENVRMADQGATKTDAPVVASSPSSLASLEEKAQTVNSFKEGSRNTSLLGSLQGSLSCLEEKALVAGQEQTAASLSPLSLPEEKVGMAAGVSSRDCAVLPPNQSKKQDLVSSNQSDSQRTLDQDSERSNISAHCDLAKLNQEMKDFDVESQECDAKTEDGDDPGFARKCRHAHRSTSCRPGKGSSRSC